MTGSVWAVATHVFFNPSGSALNYVCFAPPRILAVLLLVNFLFTGLASWVSEDEDREWWACSAAWILITIGGWIVVNVIVLWGAQAITMTDDKNRLVVFLGNVQANPIAKTLLGAFGSVTGLVAVLLTLRSKFSRKLGAAGGTAQWIMAIVALVFFVLLSVVISWLFVVFLLTAANLLFGIVMGFFINVNKFSLHALYRSRLIRAFLAASRTEESRQPHLFTGFDPNDNIDLQNLRAEKPLHVINTALNLVKGGQLAWQERKAESFTMSRLHCGSWHLGYRPSSAYGAAVSLGTALTISGAAANPNMGYHSSPIVGFLMTLFNVRLGWWLGNPGTPGAHLEAGRATLRGRSALLRSAREYDRLLPLRESFRWRTFRESRPLRDGLRRCKLVFVVDAGQDFDYVFEDLGNAIRKIRIDLGIPIEIRVVSPKKSEDTIAHCALGTIRYSTMDGEGTDGELIYVKPVISGDEQPDVSNYAAAHPEFPHEPTTDQWFSESQLESYRLLGLHAIDTILWAGLEERDAAGVFREGESRFSSEKSAPGED